MVNNGIKYKIALKNKGECLYTKGKTKELQGPVLL